MYRDEEERADAVRQIIKAVRVVNKHLAQARLQNYPYRLDEYTHRFEVVLPTQFSGLNIMFDLDLTIADLGAHTVPCIHVPGGIEDSHGSFVRGMDSIGADAALLPGDRNIIVLTERDDPEKAYNFPEFVRRVLEYLFPVAAQE